MGVDDGWEIIVICPHGQKLRGPLAVLRGFQPLVDTCSEAKRERMRQAMYEAMKPKKLSLRQKWTEKRLKKSLEAGLRSMTARSPDAEPPPSSPTQGQPSQE